MTMVCPNCGAVVEVAPICSNCSVDIHKYQSMRADEQEEASNRRVQIEQRIAESRKLNSDNRAIPLMAICIGGVTVALSLFLFFGDSDELGSSAQEEPSATTFNVDAATVNASEASDSSTTIRGLSARINKAYPPRNPIERARNATVFIRTSWGTLGSGFIINKNCDVITNRHVVESNNREVEKEMKQAQSRLLKSERKSLDRKMKQLQVEYQGLLEEVSQRHIKAVRHKEKIDALQLEIDTLSSRVRKRVEPIYERHLSGSEFKVSLVDGSEYKLTSAKLSEAYDLATFRLPEKNCPYLHVGNENNLQQGMQLFTIGSPSGLTYTVTSGVFSGFREDDYGRYLQTDAPINPGNSGGPLITQNGQVVGINTSILEGTEGIGFSLPIEYALREFK